MVPPDIVGKLPQSKRQNTDTVVTDHEVVFLRTLKGQNDKTITVVQPGGTLGSRHFVNEHETLLRPGSTYLLFLRRGEDGKYFIVGGAQGAYDVRSNKLSATGASATSDDVRSQLHGRTVDSVASDPALHSSSVQPASPASPGSGPGDLPSKAPAEKLQAQPPG